MLTKEREGNGKFNKFSQLKISQTKYQINFSTVKNETREKFTCEFMKGINYKIFVKLNCN